MGNYVVHQKEKDPIVSKFEEMGARVKFGTLRRFRRNENSNFSVDVRRDKKGEYFDIRFEGEVDFNVVNIDPKLRHLLLMAKENRNNTKILCGHDEREWFTSQVSSNAKDVKSAIHALKPAEVVVAQKRAKVKTKNLNKRHNDGFVRQGEWFFVKRVIHINEDLILKNEPLILSGVRAGNKPHIAQFAYRTGGNQVYVPNVSGANLFDYPSDWRNRLEAGLTSDERREFIKRFPNSSKIGWRPMVRNPELYIKGTVRHPDHKTILLRDWCRVYVNGEIRGANVVFLD